MIVATSDRPKVSDRKYPMFKRKVF
jgi:hypothetical protein